MKPQLINTSERFTWARQQLGLNKTDLAALLRLRGKGRETIRRIEAGQAVPGPYQIAMEALLAGWRPRGVKLEIDK